MNNDFLFYLYLERRAVLDQNRLGVNGDQAERLDSQYDLVVVGAGIAGLNALHAASRHLPPTARVLIIDVKDSPGGMWTMAYDYVRLHQPHPLFTVGGSKWTWRKPPHYLAAGDEVQQHLASCLETLRDQFDVEERFGHYVSDVREVSRSGNWGAQVDFRKVGDPNKTITVEADRVIHAAGFDYVAPNSIEFTSKSVLSITPTELSTTLANHQNAPVYIVGGGKTGMDTIVAALKANPKRVVTLINGDGTYYWNRTKYFPSGLRRWTGGALAAHVIRDCAMRFDGHNEGDMRAHFIATYAVNNDPRSKNFMFGLLSEDENKQIEMGLNDKLWDYLEDVVDGETGPVMRMRSGAEMPVPEGSIFVNCTGSLFRTQSAGDRMPCLSPNDVVLSINTHEAVHILTTYSSFILSHLFLCGKLRGAGLYFLDLEALLQKDKQAFSAACIVQGYHNQLMGLKNLPLSSLKHFGMDLNRWYPLPRRLWAIYRIRKTGPEDIQHCRESLDALVKRFDILGGQLT